MLTAGPGPDWLRSPGRKAVFEVKILRDLIRLLEEAAVDRAVLDGILEKHGLAEKFKKLEDQRRED